jgi:large subunit ribosomal protein L18
LDRVRSKAQEKRQARLRKHSRVRDKIRGTADVPRLCVFRSLGHIYAQVIDDNVGKTIVSASSLHIDLPAEEAVDEKKKPESVKMRRSRAVGKAIAEKAVEKGIKKVVFDRGGFLYHGRVAGLADAARKNGLEF